MHFGTTRPDPSPPLPLPDEGGSTPTLPPPDKRRELAPAASTAPSAAELRAVALSFCKRAVARDPTFDPKLDLDLKRLEELGRGGMGVVYRVRDARLGRDGALKLMHAGLADEGEERFKREVRITARLEHPSIPPIYSAGTTAAGQHYMLMRVVEGESLAMRIRSLHDQYRSLHSAATPLRELLEVLARVGEAVSYAHEQGIIHRDLKPSNIMTGVFGEVMVLDWGVARDAREQEDFDQGLRDRLGSVEELPPGEGLTGEGAILGTLGYMPPEQASGAPLDERADVFALGAILTTILTGQPPIRGHTPVNRIHATVTGKIETPAQRRSDVPPELDSIARRALAVDRQQRTPSVRALTKDLRAYLASADVSAHRYRLGERFTRAVARNPTRAVAAGASLLLLVVATTLVALWRGAEGERELAVDWRTKIETTLGLLDQAEDAAHQERRDEVAPLIEQALELHESRSTLWRAAKVYEEARLFEQANEVLERVRRLYPPGYRALYFQHRVVLRMHAKQGTGLTPPLLLLIALAKSQHKENEYTSWANGAEAGMKGQDELSITHYDKALARNPRLTLALAGRGAAKNNLKRYSEALEDAELAVELDPNNYHAVYVRGFAAWKLGRLKAAQADFDLVIRHLPNHDGALLARGSMKSEAGDLEAAAEDLVRVSTPQRNDDKARYGLLLRRGNALRDASRTAEALRVFEQALAIERRPGVLETVALLCWNDGEERRAFKLLDEAVLLAPKDAEIVYNRGTFRLASGNLAGAESDLSRAWTLDPSNWDARVSLAVCRATRGKVAEAARELEEFLRDHRAPLGYLHLGRMKKHLGDKAGALAAFQEVERIPPTRKGLDGQQLIAGALVEQGHLLAGGGDFRAALLAYQRAVAALPSKHPLAKRSRQLVNAVRARLEKSRTAPAPD